MDMKSRLAKLIKDNCELQLEVSDSQVSDVEELDRIASVLNGAQTKVSSTLALHILYSTPLPHPFPAPPTPSSMLTSLR